MARPTVDAATLVEQVERDLVRAKRKAGKTVGRAITKAQRAKMKGEFATLSKRRAAGVGHFVSPTSATLVMVDRAPMAALQEDGGTVSAPGGFLRIRLDTGWIGGRTKRNKSASESAYNKSLREDGKTFTIRAKDGRIFVMRKMETYQTKKGRTRHSKRSWRAKKVHGQWRRSAFPIALLTPRTTHRARLGYQETVEAHADDYAEAVETELGRLL